jgi:hypothetical protein
MGVKVAGENEFCLLLRPRPNAEKSQVLSDLHAFLLLSIVRELQENILQ